MITTVSFEVTMAEAREALKQLREPADFLAGEIATAARSAPGAELRDADGVDVLQAFDAQCALLSGQQETVHGLLAREVERISATVDHARQAVEQQEIPLATDRLVGLLSKRAMLRRMMWRARHSDWAEHLLIAVGRADRMAGMIKGQRGVVMMQRAEAEKALALFLGAGDSQSISEAGEDEPRLDQGGLARERMGVHFSAFVDVLNRAVQDHTVLMHKLTFDVERALEVYRLMIDIGSARKETLPVAEAYPHFMPSVRRLAGGMVPGGRLAISRERAENAFTQRFQAS